MRPELHAIDWTAMYDYRQWTPEIRQRVVEERRRRQQPWHAPPHKNLSVSQQYLITGACYEHQPIIGHLPERMTECEAEVLTVCRTHHAEIYAWCVLPNHYHVLVKDEQVKELCSLLGKFHGRSSFTWNGEEQQRGRKVWYRCWERAIKSERHFWASLNYVHHNPVHHGYVERWQDWPWSSAAEFLEQVGREQAMAVWRAYPILDYGKKWDV